MREGSYAAIEKGMRVIGSDGHPIGSVDEVVVDEGSGIFVGLSVRPNLFAHPIMVPGEHVDRLHDGIVHISATQADLKPYNTPEERHHDTAEAYQGTTP